MAGTLYDSINTYNDLMTNGYSDFFKDYVKAVQSSAPAQFDKFYHSDDLDKYFTCYYSVPSSNGYTNKTGPDVRPTTSPTSPAGARTTSISSRTI